MNLAEIPAFASGDTFHVVVEAPRGSSLKLKYDARWQAMSVSRPLPLGVTFPFDWGFVPSTHGADGDPLDAMVLWDVPSHPGAVLECRAIGVLQVEQNRTNRDGSARIRNDRLLAIPVEARREQGIATVDALPDRVRRELEQFTIAATALEGKDVTVLGWGDAAAAITLLRDAAAREGAHADSPAVRQPEGLRFDHVGVVTTEKKPGERWVEATRVWVTSPRDHPYNIEFLRFEPDSPVTGPLRTEPHVAYRVKNIRKAIEGHDIVLEPFDVGNGFMLVAFVTVGGGLVEFMQYANPDEVGWF